MYVILGSGYHGMVVGLGGDGWQLRCGWFDGGVGQEFCVGGVADSISCGDRTVAVRFDGAAGVIRCG